MRRPLRLLAGCLAPLILSGCIPGRGSPSPSPSAVASRPAASVVAAAATATPAPTPTPAGSVYTVKSGDTLSRIAAENGSSVDAIARANNISDPDKIQAGQRLVIPVSETASAPAKPAGASASASLPPAASKPPPP